MSALEDFYDLKKAKRVPLYTLLPGQVAKLAEKIDGSFRFTFYEKADENLPMSDKIEKPELFTRAFLIGFIQYEDGEFGFFPKTSSMSKEPYEGFACTGKHSPAEIIDPSVDVHYQQMVSRQKIKDGERRA